jgi:hypothetical protein
MRQCGIEIGDIEHHSRACTPKVTGFFVEQFKVFSP